MHSRILIVLCFLFISNVGITQLLTPEQLDTCRTYKSIESAMKHPDEVYILSLQKLKLKEFPTEILAFKNLQKLDLSKNKLKELPLAIGTLSNLQSLNLSKNNFVEFPDGICELTELKRLEMNQNQLQALPAAIGKLVKLEYLDLWSNDLGLYPTEMSELVMLKELDLRVIQLSKSEQLTIKSYLPKTTIHFSPSCDCAR